ncbi:MAG: hypothetical protein JNL67_18770 [Planctomycetaceae bacterium]|nr:hypothetical protein [Planctomycetaceae bacterium]
MKSLTNHATCHAGLNFFARIPLPLTVFDTQAYAGVVEGGEHDFPWAKQDRSAAFRPNHHRLGCQPQNIFLRLS